MALEREKVRVVGEEMGRGRDGCGAELELRGLSLDLKRQNMEEEARPMEGVVRMFGARILMVLKTRKGVRK